MNKKELEKYISALTASIPTDENIQYLTSHLEELKDDQEGIDYIYKRILLQEGKELKEYIQALDTKKLKEITSFLISDLDPSKKQINIQGKDYLVEYDQDQSKLIVYQQLDNQEKLIVKINGKKVHGRITSYQDYVGYIYSNIHLQSTVTLFVSLPSSSVTKGLIAILKTSMEKGLSVVEQIINQASSSNELAFARGVEDDDSIDVGLEEQKINLFYDQDTHTLEIIQDHDHGFDFEIEINGTVIDHLEKEECESYNQYTIKNVEENSEIKIYKI